MPLRIRLSAPLFILVLPVLVLLSASPARAQGATDQAARIDSGRHLRSRDRHRVGFLGRQDHRVRRGGQQPSAGGQFGLLRHHHRDPRSLRGCRGAQEGNVAGIWINGRSATFLHVRAFTPCSRRGAGRNRRGRPAPPVWHRIQSEAAVDNKLPRRAPSKRPSSRPRRRNCSTSSIRLRWRFSAQACFAAPSRCPPR